MAKILAIDLGKFNSEVCVLDTGTGEIRFQRITSDRWYLRSVLQVERPDVVVFEACTMAGWVFDLCRELGLRAKVANTCGEAWKFKNLKRKTDRDDAQRLATLEAMGELPEVRVPKPAVRERRSLIVFRQSLTRPAGGGAESDSRGVVGPGAVRAARASRVDGGGGRGVATARAAARQLCGG